MTRVFSVCLWGNLHIYNVGAIRNADLCKKYYPDFEYWIYIHKPSVPEDTINELRKRNNVKIIFKDGDLNTCSPMSWRFESIDDNDVEIMLCRDIDTIILEREVVATNEWIQSGKSFHIMRDHPHHSFLILGGMFSTKKIKNLTSWKEFIYKTAQNENRMYDMNFLRDTIYPLIKDDCLIHDNFWRTEDNCQYFSTKYNDNCDFVGMYVNPDESRSERHMKIIQQKVKELKDQGIFL
jgi:hypothetical protein